MSFNFRRNTKTVEEINEDFSSGKLIVDQTYQRRKVWNPQDKVRLIETILLEFIFPEVFFWTTDRDPDTGSAITHIVDGQQRICSIVEYIDGEFSLEERFLLTEEIKNKCGGKKFKELDSSLKNIIWEYPVSIVEIDSTFSKDDIKQMFFRLNLTNYNLNQQEKRHSKDSAFGDKSTALSEYGFWEKARIFSSTDAKRMKDVEYCSSIYILANEGIVDQTNGKKLNDYYEDYAMSFDEDECLTAKIFSAMGIIESLIDKTTASFISKKAQMYTLFCMIFKMYDHGISMNSDIFEKFKLFVDAYSKFRNEYVFEFKDGALSATYAAIKKYKLASSEGINKINNRMIRFEELYKICIESSAEMKKMLHVIASEFAKKLEENKESIDKLDADDLIDISESMS